MGRPQINTKKAEEPKKVVVATQAAAPVKQDILTASELADLQLKQNSELNEKTLIAQSIDDIKVQRERAEKAFKAICEELNLKKREIDWINTEIGSQNIQLKNIKTTIEKEKAEEIESLRLQTARVNKANEDFKAITNEVKDNRDFLDSELHKISEERRQYEGESVRLNKAMSDNQDKLKYGLIDLDEQRAAFEKEKEEFEELKQSLTPELTRISEIKNENETLKESLNTQTETLQAERQSFRNEKEGLYAQIEAEKKRVIVYENEVKEKEAALENKTQELSDLELELKAREIEVEKSKKRFQLTQKIEAEK